MALVLAHKYNASICYNNNSNCNICYNDNHVEYSKNFFPSNVAYECGDRELAKDNIFAAEFDDCNTWEAGDTCLAMNELVTDAGGGNPKTTPIYDVKRD